MLQENFPISCIEFAKKNSISVSCGCYESKKEVILSYKKLKNQYKKAHIVEINSEMYHKYLPIKALIHKVIKTKEIEEDNTTVIPFDVTVNIIKMDENDK